MLLISPAAGRGDAFLHICVTSLVLLTGAFTLVLGLLAHVNTGFILISNASASLYRGFYELDV